MVFLSGPNIIDEEELSARRIRGQPKSSVDLARSRGLTHFAMTARARGRRDRECGPIRRQGTNGYRGGDRGGTDCDASGEVGSLPRPDVWRCRSGCRSASSPGTAWRSSLPTGKRKLTLQTAYLSRAKVRGQGFKGAQDY